ncbi:MAG: hypothetical protein U5K29_11350 [Acidimicrobiales bacterium]|nr:hypothetical protein [Acidimicrobiales bacterium]
MRRITMIALSALLIGALAACGDDTDGDDSALTFQTDAEGNITSDEDLAGVPDDDPDDDIPPIGEGSSDDGGEPTSGSGAVGTVAVDGVEIGLDEVIRCEEDSSDLEDIERLLEVSYTGGDYFLSLYTSEVANVGVTQSVDFASPDGRFGGSSVETAGGWTGVSGPSETPPYTVDGNRITGSATLTGSMDPDASVEVSFDVVFPDETTQCR